MSLLGPNLEAFLSISRLKTVVAAALELGITQTGVTQRIRSLETQLEASLFTRSRQGMRLTSEGESLLRYCKSVVDLEGETLAKIRGAGKTSDVRVSVLGPTSIMRTRIIPRCLSLLEVYPELLLTFEISDSRSGSDALRSGAVEFAVIPPDEVAREMESKLLKPEQYVLVGPKAWQRRDLKDIVASERIVDFNPSDQSTNTYLKKFKLSHYAKSERHFVNGNESLIEMIRRGFGYGVLTKEFADSYLKDYEIALLNQGRYFENRLALAWYPRPKNSTYFQAITRTL